MKKPTNKQQVQKQRVKNNSYTFKKHCDNNNFGTGTLYIIECSNDKELFLKVGITSRTVEARFAYPGSMPYNYKIIKELQGDAMYIYELEQFIHKNNKYTAYQPRIDFSGSKNECYCIIPTLLESIDKQIVRFKK